MGLVEADLQGIMAGVLLVAVLAGAVVGAAAVGVRRGAGWDDRTCGIFNTVTKRNSQLSG